MELAEKDHELFNAQVNVKNNIEMFKQIKDQFDMAKDMFKMEDNDEEEKEYWRGMIRQYAKDMTEHKRITTNPRVGQESTSSRSPTMEVVSQSENTQSNRQRSAQRSGATPSVQQSDRPRSGPSTEGGSQSRGETPSAQQSNRQRSVPSTEVVSQSRGAPPSAQQSNR